ncbi:hypothetical protein [Hahella ganghwensis]|uniref:hypothetical protein n=1 Tax=Hahella ganghwensis TaxID=286420 RepID=UPI0003783223|nr:hypothetical protein [Hahella ganghwensis]
MYDLDNPPAPANGVLTQISGTLFKRWMTSCNAVSVDGTNAFQMVAILCQSEPETLGNAIITPNWHLTMMGNRDSTISVNFHFKVEIGKPYSHYWHYELYRVAASRTWHWVGHANPLIPETNQGGGGAGSDIQALRSNLTLVQLEARRRRAIEKGMSKSIRDKLLQKLNKWDRDGIIHDDGTGVFTGGTTV